MTLKLDRLAAVDRRRVVLILVLALGIPVLLTAEYWILGRLSVFKLHNANPFFFPQLNEVVATGGVPTWSPIEAAGTFTRAQSRETLKLLPVLARLFGPVATTNVLYLLCTAVAAGGTFLLVRRATGCSAFFGVAAAYIYANIFFEQLSFAPEYAVWMMTPLVLLVFGHVLPEREGVMTKAGIVVGLSLAVGFVADFGRQTVWFVPALTPIVLLYVRPFRWPVAGWWALFAVLSLGLGARVVYTILATNPFSDRAYFSFAGEGPASAQGVEWLKNVYVLALENRYALAVVAVFLAFTTYLKEYELRHRVVRHILVAFLVLVVIDAMVWGAVWAFGAQAGPALRSLTMRMQGVLWSCVPIAAVLVAGHLPRDLGITAGRQWVMPLGTGLVIVLLVGAVWVHVSRFKSNVAAWLNNETVGVFLDYEPFRRLRAADPSVFRVAVVQSSRLGAGNLHPGHLMYYGFETSDSVLSNQIHVLRQFWGLVLRTPSYGTSMSMYLTAPVFADGVNFDRHFSLPLLSVMNTKYLVSRAPIVGHGERLVPVHVPHDPMTDAVGPTNLGEAVRRNFSGGAFHIYRNLDAFERVFLVSTVRAFPDQRALLEALGEAGSADLRQAVFVLARDAARLGRVEPDPAARVTLDRYVGWSLDMAVTTRTPTALVISNTFGPWWRCRTGDRELETFPAYHAWIGVALPAGDQRVTCAIDLARFDLFGAAS